MSKKNKNKNKGILGSPPVTQEKKRSAWKGLFYAALWISGIVVGNVLLWIFSLTRLVVSLTDPEIETVFLPWVGPNWFKLVVFLLVAWSPWLVFVLARTWYKYTHNKEEVAESRDLVDRAWELVNAKQDEVLGMMKERVTVDGGDNLGPTYGAEDVEEILKSRTSFERKAQRQKQKAR